MTERSQDAYDQLLKNYRDLTMAERNIREAVELSFGASLLPSGEHTGATPVDECEAIARAIYAAGQRLRTTKAARLTLSG